MDAFYASVEQRDNPSLKGKPIVVGGSPEGRGVVASASYEARKFGVRSAMSSHRALNLCPGLVFVKPTFAKYKEASRKIREIFYSVTELVEPLSLDEAYLDVTENKLGEPLASRIAKHVRSRIREELSLTASAGVAPNKFLAKLASDMRKPDGLMVIPPDRVAEILLRLPVEKLWGVGPATAKKLKALGIETTEDVRRFSESTFEKNFGRFGLFLFGLAHGRDPRVVKSHREPKSSGSETTFDRDILILEKLRPVVDELSEDVAVSMKKIARRGFTVTLKLRYSDFTTITRSRTSSQALDEARAIAQIAWELLEKSTEAGRRPVRLVGVSLSSFLDENAPEQLRFAID